MRILTRRAAAPVFAPLAAGVVVGVLAALIAPPSQAADRDERRTTRTARRPAVAGANVRATVDYGYSRVDELETGFSSGGSVGSLVVGEADRHRTSVEIVGTIPVTDWGGIRGRFEGGYGVTREGRDFFVSDNESFDSGRYGVGVEFLARDPDFGSLAIGGRYRRVEFDDRFDANLFGATVRGALFVPDLGAGAVDWFGEFGYDRREDESAGTRADLDFDLFSVRGGVNWYASDDLMLALGGRWFRSEGKFAEEEDREGFLEIHWLLPVPGPLPVEVFAGGSVGESELDQSPFDADSRLVYGWNFGVTVRFSGGRTLIDLTRAYD